MEETKQRGRPSKYKAEYNDIAYSLCLLGATDEQIASALRINKETVYEWKSKHRKFAEAIHEGKTIADSKVVRGLFKRAVGFTYDEVTVETLQPGKILGIPVRDDETPHWETKRKVVTKTVIPDVSACMNWLYNRQGDNWKNKQTVEFDKMDKEDMQKIVTELLNKLKE